MSEALLTMRLKGTLHPRELLARALPWLRKELLFEASKVRTTRYKGRERVESPELRTRLVWSSL